MATFTVSSGTVNCNASFNEVVTTSLVSPNTVAAVINRSVTYTNGTGPSQIDLIYAARLTFVASTPQTLDLTTLVDMGAITINFARVRELIIQSLATTAAFTMTIGAAASNTWTGFLGTATSALILPTNVGATGNFAAHQLSDPYTVGASTGAFVDATHKTLKLDPGANAFSINIIIAGCSAVS